MFQSHWHAESGLGEGEVLIPIDGLPANARPLIMVRIPPGTFDMGAPDTESMSDGDERPVHTVTIGSEFYISKYEITQAQWTAVMGSNPAADNGVGDDYPVYDISWNHCQNFVNALSELGFGSFRLPTEAEWEYAARAGTSTAFYFGDSLLCPYDCSNCDAGDMPGKRTNYMWYCGNNPVPGQVKEVGLKDPNGFGLHDILGNVCEWVEDHHHSTYDGAPTTGEAWLVPATYYRTYRGGGHASPARYCRSANRYRAYPENHFLDLGLRVAGEIETGP
jgi:formylglycine-generating enzyme required for sulfatase activity